MKDILKPGIIFKAVVKKVRKGSTFKKGDLVFVKSVSQTNNRGSLRNFKSLVIVLNSKKEFNFRLLNPISLNSFVNDTSLVKKTPFFFI